MNRKLAWVISLVLVLDLILLALFGKSYSTLLVIEPFFYAHDLLLLTIGLLAIPFIILRRRIKSIEIFFAISCLYLIYSFIKLGLDDSYIILRQFMLIGYAILIYVVLNGVFSLDTVYKNFVKYIVYFGLCCFMIQLLFSFYLLVFKNHMPLLGKHYFSPIIMLGLIITGSYALVYIRKSYVKHIAFLIVLTISLTTGHDSLYLSVGLIYFAYWFLKANGSQRIVLTLCLLTAGIGVFAFVPTFTDVNMEWRFLFWKDSLNKAMDNYFIFGDGFGIQYASNETITKLNDLFSWPVNGPQIVGDGKYLCAPHNSFISMILHIGLIAMVFLIYPLKNMLRLNSQTLDNETLFLFLGLLGMAIFSSFNVILELPHSSSLFWMVYFGLVFKLCDKKYQDEIQ